MKKMLTITIVAISLIMGLIMVDFWESPTAGTVSNPTDEITSVQESISDTFSLNVKTDQGDSIFSGSAFLSLCLVIVGIVFFRQNSYV